MNWAPRRGAPEHKLHVSVAKFLNVALPIDSFWTTIPTAGSSLSQGAKIKARGYRAGTPDLVIIYKGRAYWLELKAAKGIVAPEQRACHGELYRAGSPVGIAKDLNDIEYWLTEWLIPLRATVDPRQAQRRKEYRMIYRRPRVDWEHWDLKAMAFIAALAWLALLTIFGGLWWMAT